MKKPKKIKDKKLLRIWMQEAVEGAPEATPLCSHFGECGGCELQNIAYEAQVEAKKSVFGKMIAHLEADRLFSSVAIETEASPVQYQYRQRMDYVFAFNSAGLRRRGSHRVVIEIEECHLIGTPAVRAFRRTRELAVEYGLSSHDYLRHAGYLRYFVVRHNRKGETLLSLVTYSREHEEVIERIAKTLLDEGHAAGVYWLLQDAKSDLSFGEPLNHYGVDTLEETFHGFSFQIGPNTFFQANPTVAEIAYRHIMDFCEQGGGETALDLYSGTGVIAILISRFFKQVTAAENVEDNRLLAEQNFRNNNISNVDFILGDTRDYLAGVKNTPDTIVANPPRVGIDDKSLEAMLRLAPSRIAYLSCNPLTLIRNLLVLGREYEITSVCLHDMFPQTRHFETLVLLKSRRSG